MQRHKQRPLSIIFVDMTVLVLLLFTASLAGCSTFQENTILYERSAGFAGVEEKILIHADGQAVLVRKGAGERIRFSLSDEQMETVRVLLEEADLARLQGDYGEPAGVESMQYTVVYKGYTVRAVDGTLPDELVPVIEELNRIIKHSMTANPVIAARQIKPKIVSNRSKGDHSDNCTVRLRYRGRNRCTAFRR